MTDPMPRRSAWSPRVLLTVALLLAAAFSAGYLWQFVEAREARMERDDLQRELVFQKLATTLATALVQANAGSYENARTLMSRYFTALQHSVDRATGGANPDFEAILDQRDEVITALSRDDPVSEELLGRIYTRYQVALGADDPGLPVAAPAEAVDSGPAPADTLPADTLRDSG